MNKLLCTDCGWTGLESAMLTAPNPFDATDSVQGCPRCRSINSLTVACDELGCWRASSCGTPTADGYRRTCGEHQPLIPNTAPFPESHG